VAPPVRAELDRRRKIAAPGRPFGRSTWARLPHVGRRRDAERLRQHRHRPPAARAPEAVLSGINVGSTRASASSWGAARSPAPARGPCTACPGIALSQSLDLPSVRAPEGARPPDESSCDPAGLGRGTPRAGPALAAQTPPQLHRPQPQFPLPLQPDTQLRRTVPARVLVPGLFSPQSEGRHPPACLQNGRGHLARRTPSPTGPPSTPASSATRCSISRSWVRSDAEGVVLASLTPR
jgi:hypothetical protein